MAEVKFSGNPVKTNGELPKVGEIAPDFILAGQDLGDIRLNDFKGKRVILNIFPSLDTDVCAASVRRFNTEAASLDNTVILCISMDLPFAATRFCTVNGIENVATGSGFRSEFGSDYGVRIEEGPLRGLYARALVVIDEEGRVKATELVDEITNEPDYNIALSILK